jgi:hypothetical protein
MISSGCEAIMNKGGNTRTVFTKETISVGQDGTSVKSIEKLDVTTKQPSNPEKESTTVIDLNKGTVHQNIPGSKTIELPSQTSINLGRIAFLGGLVILGGGVLAAFFSLKTGIVVGITGVILIGTSVAMDAAKDYLGLLLGTSAVCGIIYGFIMLYKWNKDSKALEQTKKAINNTKKDPVVWNKLKEELEKEQDSDVKKKIKAKK